MASPMAASLWKLSRPQLLRLCADFAAIDPAHEAVMRSAHQALADRVKKLSARLMPTDPAIKSRICSLQTSLRYNFRNPLLAQHLLTHHSYPTKDDDEIRLFKELQVIGGRMIEIVTDLHLQQAYPFEEEEEGGRVLFPPSIVGDILGAVTSNDYMGRLAVAHRLFDNLLHQAGRDVCENVKSFQLAVGEGRFDVKPDAILADSFQACAGGMYADCGCPDVFYELIIPHLRIHENPVFLMFERCREQCPSVEFPTLEQDNGSWKVKHYGKHVASGCTIMEAADAFNKEPASDGTNKAVSTSTSVNARKLDEETKVLSPSAGRNKAASTSTSVNARKLDEETEVLSRESSYFGYRIHAPVECFSDELVPSELKKSLVQARTEKKWTQAHLAQMMNVKPQVVQEYESGKAIPNPQVISKLERALGVKLRGKK